MSIRAASLLSVCLQTAFQAGSVIRRIQGSGTLQTFQKGVDDPCTIADITAQKLISATLAHYFPRMTVIGEEDIPVDETQALRDLDVRAISEELLGTGVLEMNIEDVTVWVDPLDGTQGFVEGNCTGVTTLIGIAYRGVPVYGLVHEPFSSPPSTYWGGPGMTVRKTMQNGPLSGEIVTPVLPPTFTIVTSAHHCKPADISFLQSLQPTQILNASGAGHKSMMVVTGEASMYVYPKVGMKKWDTCAPEAIIKSLGGMFTDMMGRETEYHRTVGKENSAGVRGM